MDRRRQTDRPGEPDGQMRAKWTDGGGQTDRASSKHRLSVAHSFENQLLCYINREPILYDRSRDR